MTMRRPQPLELYHLSPARISAQQAVWPNQTLPRLLAERAERAPAAPALQEGAEPPVSLAEFVRLVERVAAGLRRRGVAAGDVVAYQLPTSLETVVLHYAVAWIGAVASPISLLHREHDLRYMLGLVQPKLVLARPEYRGHAYAEMLRRVAEEVRLAGDVLAVEQGQLTQLLADEHPSGPAEADPND